MFTGIVEEVGVLKEISLGSGFGNIEIICEKVLEETKIGDSIAVNGVCLTVNRINNNSFVLYALNLFNYINTHKNTQ